MARFFQGRHVVSFDLTIVGTPCPTSHRVTEAPQIRTVSRMLRPLASLSALACALMIAPAASADTARARADLHVSDLAVSGEAVSGGELRLRVRLESSGNQVSTFHWSAYLTIGGVLDGARALGTFGPVTLAPGANRQIDTTVLLPSGVTGRHRVVVDIDSQDEVDEDNEHDNQILAAGFTRIRGPVPDFLVTNVVPGAGETSPAGTIDVRVHLLNAGEVAAGSAVAVYLSRNDAVSTDDVEIGRGPATLQPGRSTAVTVRGNIPADFASGDYRVGALIDPDDDVAEIDELNNLGVAERTINVRSAELTVTTASLPGGTVFIDYYARLSASGGDGHYRYGIEQGTLPNGLRLDPATGEIFGESQESGTHVVEFGVASGGLTATAELTIIVAPSGIDLTVTTPEIGQGTLGLPFSAGLSAAGGEPPYEWSLDDGALPPGIDLSVVGWLSGIPSQEGRFTFSVLVTDALGARDEIELTVVVESANVVILTGRLPEVPVGEPVDFELQASGGLKPHTWTALSTPPPGMSITEDGHLLGTPNRVGEFAVRVGVADANEAGASDTALLHMKVTDFGLFKIVSTKVPQTMIRQPVDFVLEAQGGVAPLEWSLGRGESLPVGFTIEPDPAAPDRRAIIRGTSLRPMAHGFAVQVRDATTRKRTVTLAIDVARPDARGGAQAGCTHIAVGSSSGASLLALLGLGLVFALRRRRP